MNSKQFAWLYLIENGVAGHSHSYYGGYDLVDKRLASVLKSSNYGNLEPAAEFYKKEIKTYGVNWNKTASPDTETVSEFNGTFAEDSRYIEKLTGTLVLNNGTKQSWIADALEVTNVFDMMAQVDNANNRFKEIF